MTANDLVTRAMRTLGALDPVEVPTANEMANGFTTLNNMVAMWATEPLTIYTHARTVQALTANTTSYTIGSGGTINIARPLWIVGQKLIVDNTQSTVTEAPIALFDIQAWADIAQKSLTSTQPVGIYYDNNWVAGLARVWPWPVPSVSTTSLVLYTKTALIEFADQSTTDYTFPPGYEKALRYNLALELSAEFNIPVSQVVVMMAADSKGAIKRANSDTSVMMVDDALLSGGGRFNWRTGI